MSDFLESFLVGFVCGVIGAVIGLHQGDQAIIRACATKAEAQMFGNVVIECVVRKEKP